MIAGTASPLIRVESSLCTACRACELACHFHHAGGFGTSRSSILVTFDGDEGAVVVSFDASCDGCAGEPSLRCVASCAPGALHSTGG